MALQLYDSTILRLYIPRIALRARLLHGWSKAINGNARIFAIISKWSYVTTEFDRKKRNETKRKIKGDGYMRALSVCYLDAFSPLAMPLSFSYRPSALVRDKVER